MKIWGKISRRGFLYGAFGILGVGIVNPKQSFGLVSQQFQVNPFLSCLIGLIGKSQSATLIGKEYLAMCPQEYDPNILIGQITRNSNRLYQEYRIGGDKKVHEHLRHQIREDFGNNQKIILHGWVLSRTEARICALTHLIG